MIKILYFSLLTLNLNSIASQQDTLQQVQLSEVNVVATIKENGQMRQQPSSVTLIDKHDLSNNHIISIKETSNIVPNLFIPDYGSRLTSSIYIRGIGSRINTPAVGLYVDNIPYIDKSAFDFNFYDVERIDVLRGPQGTLYGRNTMGGLIRVYTKNPLQYEGTDAHLGYAIGDQHRNISLTHYHHISSTMAFSAGGYYEGSDGFFTNDDTGKSVDKMQAGGGHIRAVYIPTSKLKFDLTAGYDYSDEGAYPYIYTGILEGEEPYINNIGKITNNRDSRYRRGMANAGLNIEYKADKWQLNAITGYQHISDRMFMDQDFLSADIYTLEQRQKINTLTEEITIKNSKGKQWEWLSGINLMYQTLNTNAPVIFYDDGLRWLESNINESLPNISKIAMLEGMGFENMSVNFRGNQLLMNGSYDTPIFGAAIFHQSTYHINDHFSALLGIRLDYEHQNMNYTSPADVNYGFTMPNSKNVRMSINLQNLESHLIYEGKLKKDYLKVLPKLAIKYDFDRDNNIYSSFTMGQRSGGYNLQMFNDLLQGALRIDMMNGIKQGVGDYLEYLTANTPHMPSQIPNPDAPGTMISLSEYVKKIMGNNMPLFQVPTTDQVVYKPEYSWNFEIGTHTTLLCKTLTLDAAIFYSNIYNQQIVRFAPSGLGRMMVNAGKSQSFGGEISFRWSPTRFFALNGNYGYTHATFLEYEDGQDINYKDKYVPYVPMHNINIGAAYTWHFKSLQELNKWHNIKTLTLGINCYGAGKTYWTEKNNVSQDFCTQLGANLSLDAKAFGIIIWGKNLTNNTQNTFYFESAGKGFEQHCKPLRFGIDINIKL